MSQFFRMPKAWHDELDASLPKIFPVSLINNRPDWIRDRLIRRMEEGPVNKWEFCKAEGIKIATLNSAIYACPVLLWEDGGKVGLA